MTIRIKTIADWMRLFCAVAILSLGFAHKPVQAHAVRFSTEIALPDGSFSLLCLGDTDRDEPTRLGWHGCDACLVASGSMLPSPRGDHVPALRHFVALDFPTRAALLFRDALRPGSPVRGPPAIFV
jgi:hypothetical protein